MKANTLDQHSINREEKMLQILFREGVSCRRTSSVSLKGADQIDRGAFER